MAEFPTQQITVPGGQLHYRQWGQRGPLVLASHGITASHVSFTSLARAMQNELGNEFRLLAPDHRGRGRSNAITGPWGMQAHAQDMLALLDALAIPQADLMLGHSMGGFVAAVTAAAAPARIRRLLMVDGGLPLFDEPPPGMTTEALIQAVIGPAMQRLDMRFASEAEYFAYWREHPALKKDWDADFEAYLRYDLCGTAPALRPSANKAAIIGDVETQLIGPTIPDALGRLRMPVDLVTAERGIMNDAPLYSEALLASWKARMAELKISREAGVNHYTIVQSAHGAKALARRVARLLA